MFGNLDRCLRAARLAFLLATMVPATAAAQQPIAGDNPGKAERRIERILFGVEDEIEGVRIGWYIRDTFTAFSLAIDRQVPLVLVLHDGSCEYCWRMIDAFTCRSVNRFAGSAVFAIGDPDHEKRRRLAGQIRHHADVPHTRPPGELRGVTATGKPKFTIRW